MSDKKVESLAYRLKDYESLRALFAELNFEFADEPVNKESWNQDQIDMVQEAKIIAIKDDYRIYYIQTNTDSLNQWKGIATKIIKENNGLCLICSHNPSGFKWVFSSLSKDFSKSFTETRHVPIDIRPDSGVPQTFVEFLEKIKINTDSTASSIASQISKAFDSFAVAIHDELTVNVFEALKSLSEGIILDESNSLTLDEKTLEEIREPIFILLYRIIFILYAEDRGIFPTEQKIYHEKFSFKWLKQEWLLKSENQKKLSEYQVHERLWNFFRLIELGSEDLGYDSNEFFMRSYYGRIFDRKINHKLDKWKIKNQYLLDAISFLTRTRDKNNNYFFLDYSALETRQLGSIYEHLLEYHLTVKGKKIADLPNQQERQSSGSYYTPQYIVDYIVQKTVGPLIDKIRKDTNDKFEQIEKILSLNILDPAMGSGHFLVVVVEYIAKKICEIEDGEIDETRLIERKRDVVRRCVYGVDSNPLAVDLAMVSLWLETLSSEKPLSFLSAHLKCGNSLIGSHIDILFDKQTTLMESQKGREQFKRTIKDFLMFENLEDDSTSAVKTKMERLDNLQSKGTIYYDLKFLLDCKSAESFGVNLPSFGDYRAKIGENSLNFYMDESLRKVKEFSINHRFFHWELEFPDIFFDKEGKKSVDSGFDIIIGNPPWSAKIMKDELKVLIQKLGWSEKNINICSLFIKFSLEKLNSTGTLGFLLPKVTIKNTGYLEIRKDILENYFLKDLVDFGKFPGVASDAIAMVIQNSKPNNKTEISFFKGSQLIKNNSLDNDIFTKNSQFIFSLSLTPEIELLLRKIEKDSSELSRNFHIKRGIEVGQQSEIVKCNKCENFNEANFKYYSAKIKKCKKCNANLDLETKFVISSLKKGGIYIQECISGNQLKRYYILKNYFIPKSLNGISYKREAFEGNKIFLKRISTKIEGTFSDEDILAFNTVYSIYNKDLEKSDFLELLGILNSKLMEFYYEYSYNVGMNLTTQLTIDFLNKVPIKITMNKSIKSNLSNLVDQRIRAGMIDLSDKNDLDHMIQLEKQIDDIVFEIYGLDSKEVETVRNSI